MANAATGLGLSERVARIKPSSTLAVGQRAKELKAAGVDVLSFAAGEPDFATPEPVCTAAKTAIDEGLTRYAPVPGDLPTRQAIADKLVRDNQLTGVTPDHVVVSTGGKQSLYLAFQALIDPPADHAQPPAEVIIPTPAWVSYRPQAELAGARVVELETTPDNDFKITPEQLHDAVSERSRVLVLNSPSNPCGTMYSEAELRDIAAVVARAAQERAPGLVVLSDEIYEKLTFGGIPHFSIGAVPEIAERTVTVNGLSKAYAMTGWRVGYLAGSGDFGLALAKAAAKLQSQLNTSIPAFIQPAIRAALDQCDDDVERMRRAFAQRAGVMHHALTQIPGLLCPKPTGAFYAFADVSRYFGKTSPAGAQVDSAVSFAAALLDERHMAVVPGEDFGGCGPRCIRLTFATDETTIRLGAQRLHDFIESLT